MKNEFSERQYEQLLNAELMNKWSAVLLGMPEFPTPQEEVALGYDAKYKVLEGQHVKTLFFQYKISTYHTASVGSAAKYSAKVGSPFFLTKVRGPKLGNQHNVLRNLSKKNDNVYYCAPTFYEFLVLNSHFFAKTIYDNSILVSLSKLPDINDVKSHSIAYSEDGANRAFFSDPVDIEIDTLDEIVERRKWSSFDSEEILNEILTAIEDGMNVKLDYVDFEKYSTYGKINFLLNRYIGGAKLIVISEPTERRC